MDWPCFARPMKNIEIFAQMVLQKVPQKDPLAPSSSLGYKSEQTNKQTEDRHRLNFLNFKVGPLKVNITK